jgi:hypothetical protein
MPLEGFDRGFGFCRQGLAGRIVAQLISPALLSSTLPPLGHI